MCRSLPGTLAHCINVIAGCLVLKQLAAGDPPPTQSPSQYEMRTCSSGNHKSTFLRLKPATGECWASDAGEWTKLAEGGSIPAGDYDVALAPVWGGKKVIAVRIERRTGMTWLFDNDKWLPMDDPEGDKLPLSSYEVSLRAESEMFFAFRLDKKSGFGWRYKNGKWERILEPRR